MGRTRVALVAPPMDFLRSLYGFRSRTGYRNQVPLGIGYIAGALRAEGHPVAIFDAAAEGWDEATTVARVLAFRPDVVGVTAITLETPAAFPLVRAFKAAAPGVFVVLGGAHVNTYVQTVDAECPEADAFAAGDGEPTMLELCAALESGGSLAGIRGLRYRQEDGTCSAFAERPPLHDLDRLPMPAYDLYRMDLYIPLPHRRRRMPSTCIITSRGCSYGKCAYCEMASMTRRVFRRNSPARVIEELRVLHGLTGCRDVYFQDDIFITDEAWVREFCARLEASGLDIVWSCESRFQGVTEDLLRTMRKAGCWRIYYGFESGNQESLDLIRKGHTLEEGRQAVRHAREAGIEVVGFFMLGLPGETPGMGQRTIEYSLGLGLSHAMYSLTVAHPDTELYRICQENGTILRDRVYAAKQCAYLPRGYRDADQLHALQREAYRRFYLRPGYWWQCLRSLRGWDDVRYYAGGALSLLNFLE